MKTAEQKDKLEQIARKFFQKNVTIKIVAMDVENGNTNGINGRKQFNGVNEVKREAMSQPLLQKIMDELSDAKVVEIKVTPEKR